MEGVKRMVFLSLLVSIGLGLSIIESMLPVPFIAPGAKLGLSNMVTLITLVVFGFKDALAIGAIRSIAFALITGSVTSLFYSLSASILSCISMSIIYSGFNSIFSLIGVSIFGALAHNFAQVMVASLMMRNFRIFSYLPVLLLTSLFTGYFVGLASIFTVKGLKSSFNNMI